MLPPYILATLMAASSISPAMAGLIGGWPKANEYTSNDCSGDLNYGHHSPGLSEVTMDDTSHSVYLALELPSRVSSPQWYAFSGKTENGGKCSGELLGTISNECQDLDKVFGKKVQCVRKCQIPDADVPVDADCLAPA